jgi:hypothetical protein
VVCEKQGGPEKLQMEHTLIWAENEGWQSGIHDVIITLVGSNLQFFFFRTLRGLSQFVKKNRKKKL